MNQTLIYTAIVRWPSPDGTEYTLPVKTLVSKEAAVRLAENHAANHRLTDAKVEYLGKHPYM